MERYLGKNYLYLFAILLGLLSFGGAIVYRLYSLNNAGVAISLALAALGFIIVLYSQKDKNKKREYDYKLKYPAKKQTERGGRLFLLSLFFYGLFYILAAYVLFKARTAQAIISPWEVAPYYFFIGYGLATIVLIFFLLSFQGRDKISLGLISLHYFLSFSVALIVYKIGYGFDPFIHQATAGLIDKIGAVYPKPFYYLGQYSLVVILHKITTLPVVWLDKLLVPALAALFLPLAIFQFLQKWFTDKKINLLLLLLILILPFSFFIVTTPQNLAYLFLILVIFYGLTCSNLIELIVIYLLALAALAIHPLAGLPALGFALTLTVYYSNKDKLKKYFYLLIFLLSSLSLPLAFYFVNKNNGTAGIPTETISGSNILEKIIIPGQENFILNFIYLYAFNLKTIIAVLILSGLFIAYRHRQNCKIYFLNLIISASLAVAYILTSQLPFNFLISYERSDYLERILSLIIIFLIPFIIIPLYGLIKKILEQKRSIKIPFLVFLTILITTSLYLSYPSFDHYYNSHGLSVSQNDIEAVQWIENDAGKDYIVLANQQVSVAALRQFGFSRYLKPPSNSLLRKEGGESAPSPLEGEGGGEVSEVYFYPIPTGGQLYQYYLDMVYKKPDKKTMAEAMNLTGVNQSYFILNKYWWAFPKILAEAKLEADSWTEIGQGEIYIFKYKR